MHVKYTYILCLVFFSLWKSAASSAMFLKYIKNKNGSTLYRDSKPVNIQYKNGDVIELICSVTSETVHNNKLPLLSWVDNYGSGSSLPTRNTFIKHTKVLTEADDQTNLICEAISAKPEQKWSITVNFVRIKSREERRKSELNSFTILFICLGAMFLTAIVFLICYGSIKKCRQNKCGTDAGNDESPLANQPVIYSELLKNIQLNATLPIRNDPHDVEVGTDNLSCVHENPGYVKFDRPDSCVTDSKIGSQAQKAEENNVNESGVGHRKLSSDC